MAIVPSACHCFPTKNNESNKIESSLLFKSRSKNKFKFNI
ncbi:hypothetical protein PRUB_a3153 [Pseudoalteromonas rubra]|uniref:Uncharacterized protein n=1 Tax=Pseudoalteromonas rubra TaxID=43658 RepID=A0A8T0CF05_9GAMM|nr:hypothetical protein PRUB_a3153 [Pseudoalteromonas rubra]